MHAKLTHKLTGDFLVASDYTTIEHEGKVYELPYLLGGKITGECNGEDSFTIFIKTEFVTFGVKPSDVPLNMYPGGSITWRRWDLHYIWEEMNFSLAEKLKINAYEEIEFRKDDAQSAPFYHILNGLFNGGQINTESLKPFVFSDEGGGFALICGQRDGVPLFRDSYEIEKAMNKFNVEARKALDAVKDLPLSEIDAKFVAAYRTMLQIQAGLITKKGG